MSGRTARPAASRRPGWAGVLLPSVAVVVYVAASALHGGESPTTCRPCCLSTPPRSCGCSATPGSCSGCCATRGLGHPAVPPAPVHAFDRGPVEGGAGAGGRGVRGEPSRRRRRHPARRSCLRRQSDAAAAGLAAGRGCRAAPRDRADRLLPGADRTALLLTAVAIGSAVRWFAGLSAAVGAGWLALSGDTAANGFANPAPVSLAALGLIVWVVALTVLAALVETRPSTAGRSDGRTTCPRSARLRPAMMVHDSGRPHTARPRRPVPRNQVAAPAHRPSSTEEMVQPRVQEP